MGKTKKGQILAVNTQGHLDLGHYGGWVTSCNIHIKLVTPRVANTLDGQNHFHGEVRAIAGAEELTYTSTTNKHVVLVAILHGEKQGFKLIELTSLPWTRNTCSVGSIEFPDIQPLMNGAFDITNYNDTETYLYNNSALINVRHNIGLKLIAGKALDRLNPALETQLQAAGFEYRVNDGLVASYHLSNAFQSDCEARVVWNNADNDTHYDFHCRHGSLKELTALKGVDAHFVDLKKRRLVSGTFDVPKLVELYDTRFIYDFQGRTKWSLYVLQKGGKRGYLVAPRMFSNALLNAMGKNCSGFPSDREYMLAVKAVDSIFA